MVAMRKNENFIQFHPNAGRKFEGHENENVGQENVLKTYLFFILPLPGASSSWPGKNGAK